MFESILIQHLRCIGSTQFQFHPHFNLFYGPNGCGKTSLLESIYLLCTGHSFRTRETQPLIQSEQEAVVLYAKTINNQTLALKKSISKGTQVLIDHELCPSSAILAKRYPCQVVYQDIFQIIDAGPHIRRNVLDWGMFHVKPQYHETWLTYKKILKQRNALLKQNPSAKTIKPWDLQLVEQGNQLHTMRKAYIEAWRPYFLSVLQELKGIECDLDYYKGWDRKNKGISFEAMLDAQFENDRQRQTTQYGPHQADIILNVKGVHTRYGLSRGQQKIILLALKLSQAQMLNTPCIYLLDDVAAELDENHLGAVLDYLKNTQGQVFMTLIPIHYQHLENSILSQSHQSFNLECFT